MKNIFIALINRLRNYYHIFLLSVFEIRNNKNKSNKWLIISNSERNLDVNASIISICQSLVDDGWHYKFIFYGNTFFKFPNRDKISKSLYIGNRADANVSNPNVIIDEVNVNFTKKEIFIDGINFFEIINTSLCNFKKTYQIDYSERKNKEYFEKAVRSIQTIIPVCKEIRKKVELNKRIALLLLDPDRIPSSVFIKYFHEKDLWRQIDIYSFGPSYGIYNSSGSWHSGQFMLTKTNPNYAHQYFAWNEDFISWKKSIEVNKLSKIDFYINSLLSSKHYISSDSEHLSKNKNEIISISKDYKKNKKKVFCLFSHLFFDRPIIDHTHNFSDMLEWIRVTIDIFKRSENLLILKPHVVERFYPQGKRPQTTLREFISSIELSENIILIEPDLFLADEIKEHIDAAIIWRSTAHIENLIKGMPSIYCGPRGAYSEVIEPNIIKSHSDYEEKLMQLPNISISDSSKLDAKLLLFFLNKNNSIKINIFSKMPKIFGDNIYINLFKFISTFFNRQKNLKSFSDCINKRNLSATTKEKLI